MTTGILSIAFNRPQYFKQSLEGLKKQNLPPDLQYFCFIDGPRAPTDNDKIKINSLLANDFIRKVSPAYHAIVLRNKNMGCDLNIMTAVDEAIQHVDRLIIVEEDIVPCKGFMEWMTWGLDNLMEKARCQSVLAHSEPKSKQEDPAAFNFANWFTPWGWATTKKLWNCVFHSWVKEITKRGIVPVVTEMLEGRRSRHVVYSPEGIAVHVPEGWDYFCNMTYEKNKLLEAFPMVPRAVNIGKVGLHQDGVTKYPELEPRQCTSNDFDLVKDFHEG